MNKRDLVFSVAHGGMGDSGIFPAAFFLHFPYEFHTGQAAVDKHIEYFRVTGNDLIKVQYENPYPRYDALRRPRDWLNVPYYTDSFYAEQVYVVGGVVRAARAEAPVIVTLYSPFMFAYQMVGLDTLRRHLSDDPKPVYGGLRVIAESMKDLIRGCLEHGVDGFYVSTQGGEEGMLPPGVFEEFVKPVDLEVWELIEHKTDLNILHVCDFHAPYASFEPFLEYPGHIVSAPTSVGGEPITGAEISKLFGRPFMGGMDRHGVLSRGPRDAVAPEARRAIAEGPRRMILGADCTLDANADWNAIADATAVAHGEAR